MMAYFAIFSVFITAKYLTAMYDNKQPANSLLQERYLIISFQFNNSPANCIYKD